MPTDVLYKTLSVCDVTTGALGVVWFVLWMVCASESPSQHGRINTAERQYIIDTLMTEAVHSQQVSARSDDRAVLSPGKPRAAAVNFDT